MTPDYVTTGIVSNWADHIEIKDEDLILRQLRACLCCMVGPEIFKVYGYTFVYVRINFITLLLISSLCVWPLMS